MDYKMFDNMKNNSFIYLNMFLTSVILIRVAYLRNTLDDSDEYMFIWRFAVAIIPPFLAWAWCNESLYNYLTQDMEKPLAFKTHLSIGKIASFILLLVLLARA